MNRAVPILLLSALLGHAPLQCGSEPDPSKALEETPGEAIYKLAHEFRAQGDEAAWAATLQFLIENYPSSRFAEMAKVDLDEAGIARPTSPGAGDGVQPGRGKGDSP